MPEMPKLPDGYRWLIDVEDSAVFAYVTYLDRSTWIVDESYPAIKVYIDYPRTEEEIKTALSEKAHNIINKYNADNDLVKRLRGWANGGRF